MPLSVNQIAQRICRSDQDIDVIRERIRHWAKSGVLAPIGGQPGQGRSRHFERAAVIDAALLSALVDLGFTRLGGELNLARAMMRQVACEWARGDKSPRWLELVRIVSTGFSAHCVPHIHVDQPKLTPGTHGAVVVNLMPLLAKIDWKLVDEETKDPLPDQPRKTSRRRRAPLRRPKPAARKRLG